jgi:hypothetical protein
MAADLQTWKGIEVQQATKSVWMWDFSGYKVHYSADIENYNIKAFTACAAKVSL